jgi:hypothetical protein
MSAEVLGALKAQVPRFVDIVGRHIGVVPWVKGADLERLSEHWSLGEHWNVDEALDNQNPDARESESDL